jgi:hypothetical protein
VNQRRRARAAVYRAVRRGALPRPNSCASCGAKGRVEGHHIDYSRPLDVEWLCPKCHRRADALPRQPCPRCGRADRWARLLDGSWVCVRCRPPKVLMPPMPRRTFARMIERARSGAAR